ncbi:MAG: pectin acetylesterase-family hydrolase [Myxococcota bacterium]
MLLLLAACHDPPAPPEGDGDPPPIAALPCEPSGRHAGPPGDDLHRVTLTDAAARCNDGTPPVLWVRAATDPAHARDWVVHLEGGGLCRTAAECAARWCGGTPPYDASDMSSAWAPLAVEGHGIASPRAANAFAGYNQVRVHYCSSDLWLGTVAAHAFDDPDVGAYTVALQGDGIVQAVLDALLDGVAPEDGAAAPPPLSDARLVVLNGASAGGYGALLRAWRVVDALPDAEVVVSADAAFSPDPEVLPPDARDAVEADLRERYADIALGLWATPLEPACLAAHDAEPWRCLDLATVLRERLPGAAAVHHDLFDAVLQQSVPVGTLDDYAAWSAATLALLAQERPEMALHGAACGRHTVTDDDVAFFGVRVDGASYHEVLADRVAGERRVAVDDPTGAGSRCP